MPHAVFAPGDQTASADLIGRQLIPGVDPGGSRAGKATKPALLIRDAWLELRSYRDSGVTVELQIVEVFLKLSQELDLDPGLLLPVGRTVAAATATASLFNHLDIYQEFAAHGTIWAPSRVGIRLAFTEGTPTEFIAQVHLDYDVVQVPWMDWFIMWEFLDGIADNELEY